jgi:hypothetical protein
MQKQFLFIILLINCSLIFGQKDYDKVTFVNNSEKDTVYQIFYNNELKECVSTSIVITPPNSSTIVAYPKTKKISVEQADTKQKVINGIKEKKIKDIEKIEDDEKLKDKEK